jgi:ankyrin repeat protein
VNVKDNMGHTALMGAARQGRMGQVKALLAAGAAVNARDYEGLTALGAAKGGDVVAILRSAGGTE